MKVLEEGSNRLLMDPDPDRARAGFRGKSRALANKLMSASEAVRRFVQPGDYLIIGAFGVVRIPTVILHELVRQRIRGLKFAGHTATHDCQILAAGECFDYCDIAYVIGLEARGVSPQARRYFESGKVEMVQWTNAALAWRLRAAAMGIPFIPARHMLGTDTLKHSAAKVVECPYTGRPLVALPALYPDLGIVHVHEADIYGNCRIKGIMVADDDLARACKKLIITAERIVPTEEIRRDPSSTVIPYYCVDAVVEAPYGSYPGNMPYEYYSDERHLREWLEAEKDPEGCQRFVDRLIRGTKDFSEYLQLCGGLSRMTELRRQEYLIRSAAGGEVGNG